MILTVLPAESRAARTGLLEGDVIQAVNGSPVKTSAQFLKAAPEFSKGEKFELKIVRLQQAKVLSLQFVDP